MIRAQCLVHRDLKILLAKHTLGEQEWWCLPGGGVEAGETPAQAALRELKEECGVAGRILGQVSTYTDAEGVELVTFLVDIGEQEPHLGTDPEFSAQNQILVDINWLALDEICKRDRAYLFAAGLLSIPHFLLEVSRWGDDLSYPGNRKHV
jgi:8-oxo-dGTP diphosphatase